MHRIPVAFLAAAGAVAAIAGLATLPLALDAQPPAPHHQAPAAKHGGVVVMLCDGKTSIEIKGLKPGQRMSHEQASNVTRELMASWQRAHPGERWEMAQAQSPAAESAPTEPAAESPSSRHPRRPAARRPRRSSPGRAGSEAGPGQQQQGDTYASFHERDFKVWQAETQKFIEEGKRVFTATSCWAARSG